MGPPRRCRRTSTYLGFSCTAPMIGCYCNKDLKSVLDNRMFPFEIKRLEGACLKQMDSLRPCSRRKKKQPKRVHSNPSTLLKEKEKVTEEKRFVGQRESIPIMSSVHSSKKARVTFVLENAALKKGVVGKTVKILNSDEDANFLLKQKKNLNDFRPDILYRTVLAIFDSPVCKAGLVQAIYVKVNSGVLFEIKPHVRVPRTIKRFNGLMLDLLQKSSIVAKDTGEKLLRVIEQPLTRHLPPNSRVIGLSYGSKKVINLSDSVPDISNDVNLVFVVGAMPQGTIDKLYTDEFISISNYRLSASRCVGEICDALEDKWDII